MIAVEAGLVRLELWPRAVGGWNLLRDGVVVGELAQELDGWYAAVVLKPFALVSGGSAVSTVEKLAERIRDRTSR